MTIRFNHQSGRRKAVWGPKRVAAALMLVAFGFTSSANAKGQNSGPSGNSGSGSSNSGPGSSGSGSGKSKPQAKGYKLDAELSKRKNANPNHVTSVIVTLVPGAQLP